MSDKSELNQNIPQRSFKGIWIPAEIWEHPRLNILQKTLYAEICSLETEEGCFASNEYFMKFFGMAERNLQNNLKVLKEEGLIYTAKTNGRMRWLKTLHPRPAKNCTPDMQDFAPRTKEKESTKEKEYIYNKKEEEDASCDAGAKAPPDPYQIKLSEEEKNKLVEKVGKDKTDYYTEALYNHLKSIGKPQKYKSHYHTILNWILRDEKKKNINEQTKKTAEKISDSIEVKIIQDSYNKYFERLNDPAIVDKGFMKIEGGKFYNTKNPEIKYNFTIEKFLNHLEYSMNVNRSFIEDLKNKISKIERI